MATQKIKKSNIDQISKWTWCRPAPVASTALSYTCSDNVQYIYYLVGSAFYRYDTMTDSWAQLTSISTAPLTVLSMKYSTSHGYYGRAISNGGGNNTIQLAGLQGNIFVGKKIKILSGKGAGQERTIIATSNPIVHDRGAQSSISTSQLIDNTKQLALNQWRDYQARLTFATNAGILVRKILYNLRNNLTLSDVSFGLLNYPLYGNVQEHGAMQYSHYQIESNILTVDSSWDITPDSSSQFVILSGGIWVITSNASDPFYTIQYYDVAANTWNIKTSMTGFSRAAIGTDIALENIKDTESPLLTGTITSVTLDSLADSSLIGNLPNYSNYEIRILSGAARGQSRVILANTSSNFIITRSWDITPSIGDTYGIYKDTSKIYIIGNNSSAIAQYDLNSDITSCGKIYDYGIVRSVTATLVTPDAGTTFEPTYITSMNRTTGGISVLNPVPTAAGTGYLAGQILTITTGGTGGTARILAVDANGGVTQVAIETLGSNYTTGSGKATTVSPNGGTGCTLDITSIAEIASFTTTSTSNPIFKIGDLIKIAGFAQSDYNGIKTIIGNGVTANPSIGRYSFVVLNSPVTPGTASLSQTSTRLVDASKNWVTNEHVGKLLSFTYNNVPPNAGGFIVRILSNTATSITFTSTITPNEGSSKYAIISDRAFGTEESIESIKASQPLIKTGNSGVATSGTTTSLTDTTKNWPVNYWSNTFPSGASNTGRKVRIIKGTGAGTEMIITSNTATTLNFATQSFSPDQTTVYQILDNFGAITTGGTTTFTDSTQNWTAVSYVNKRVKITGGPSTAVGFESMIANVNQPVLTLQTSISTDANTNYAILSQNNRSTAIELFNIKNSSDSNLNRYIYMFRGGGTNEINRYDIASETIDFITYFPFAETLTTGSMYAYDGEDRIYFTKESTGRIYYYDIVKNIVINTGTVPYGMSTAILGNRMEIVKTENGDKWLFIMRHSGQEMWRLKLN